MPIDSKNRPRFSPIRNLTPDRLTQMLDAFEQGYLAEAALTWDTIEKRDDTIKSVAPKRKKAIARHGWEVIVLPNLPCDKQPEALRHKEALEYFYTNLTCSHALDGNERGGFKLLVRQMMDAIGKRYAVHEILWKPERLAASPGTAGLQPGSVIPHTNRDKDILFNRGASPLLGQRDNGEGRPDTSLPRLENHSAYSASSAVTSSLASTHNPSAQSAQSAVNQHSSSAIPDPHSRINSFSFRSFDNHSAYSASSAVTPSLPSLPSVENQSACSAYSAVNPSAQSAQSAVDRHFNSAIRNPHSAIESYRLTAELRFVPLWFFENTTGELRFLKSPYFASYLAGGGEPLQPGAWMITAGEGLMTACSIAWMYKNLPLQDWLDFSHRYGHPALVAATSAARNSSEWLELEKVMEDFLSQLSAMTTAGEQIKLIDLKGGGDLPYERLISRMDRLITALWRGADLSTLSREQGYGASLQAGESDILEQDDAEMISETLQTYLDRHVIEYLFGKGVKPLAAVKILVTPKQSTPQDLQIDEFLINHGARLAINDTLARYGRAEANPGEPALERPHGTAGLQPGSTMNRRNRRQEILTPNGRVSVPTSPNSIEISRDTSAQSGIPVKSAINDSLL